MRILQIIQKTQLRGAEIFACQLSKELINMGHEVHIVSLFEHQSDLPFNLTFIPLKAIIEKRFWDFQAYSHLNKIIREGNYDIVQSNAGDTLKYTSLSKAIFGWKTPLVYRNANKISDFLNTRMKYYVNRYFFRQVSHVISVSELCRNDFVETFGISNERIDTVQIGIDVKNADRLSDELLKIFDNGPVLLHVGSFVPEKNHAGLLSIFIKVLVHLPEAKLVLIGKGRLENEIRKKAEGLGIMDKVYFLGNRTDVQSVMYSSQALLLPSVIEGLPAVILEAQLAKIPVIAYDVGGISEIIQKGETGWLIEKGDEESFAVAVIEGVQGNRIRVERIIEKAHDQVLRDYNNLKIADRFYKIYDRVVEKGRLNA